MKINIVSLKSLTDLANTESNPAASSEHPFLPPDLIPFVDPDHKKKIKRTRKHNDDHPSQNHTQEGR